MNDDTISRQAAIATAISGRVRTLPTTEDGENWIRVNEVRDNLLSLPSAERHGHWTLIDKGHNFYDWECSICGGSGRGDYAFCPWCGVIMDEDIPIEYFENGGI